MKTKKRSVLVAWSGGLDSTFVLLYHLRQKDLKVASYAVIHSQVVANEEHQEARFAIQRYLKKKEGLKWVHRDIVLGEEESFGIEDTNYQYLSMQAILWTMVGSLILEPDQDLMFGYIQKDRIWHKIGSLIRLFRALQEAQGKKGIVVFPAEWWTKTDIFSGLDEELISLCWHCEYPIKGWACHTCEKCKDIDKEFKAYVEYCQRT